MATAFTRRISTLEQVSAADADKLPSKIWPACGGTGFFGRCLAPVARDASQKMVSKDHKLSMRRQWTLLTLTRSNLYFVPRGESAINLQFMAVLNKQFLETPCCGLRQMARHMKLNNHQCGRHQDRRLMRLMRLVPVISSSTQARNIPSIKSGLSTAERYD